ncbi:uncharacterized protein METZ01_LOCUS300666, partial [marine metagenome]
MAEKYDRAAESLGNILHMEHVNLTIPEQEPAISFYISGLGMTRDPFLMTGVDNMWVNMGRTQLHLPSRDPFPQRFRGTLGIVVPDLNKTEESLGAIENVLGSTKFSFVRKNNCIEATCPWGNQFRIHEPAPEYGTIHLGMPYLDLNAPLGSAEKIAHFYSEIIGAIAHVGIRNNATCASISTGNSQSLHFVETDVRQPEYDGHHVAIYITDFVGPYEKLIALDLISQESDEYEWRFIDIVDIDTGELIFKIEHEVRSATHPLYARPLVNRNPAQSNRGY